MTLQMAPQGVPSLNLVTLFDGRWCGTCGSRLSPQAGRGRPAIYCSARCRTARYRKGGASSPAKSARNAAVIAAILSGRTATDVAHEHGISRERARQIFTRTTGSGVPALGRQCPTCRARYPSTQGGSAAESMLHRQDPRHAAVVESRRNRRRVAAIARFWTFVDKNGPVPDFAPRLGPCWIWTGPSDEVKAGFVYGRSTVRFERFAHRAAYVLTVGPIPSELQIDHLCRVTLCCNPAHLETVTCKENVRRGKTVALRHLHAAFTPRAQYPRTPRVHCAHGHERTPGNTYPKSGNCRPCQQARDDARRDAKRAA